MKTFLLAILAFMSLSAHADSCSLDFNNLKSSIDVQDKSQYLKLGPVVVDQVKKTKSQSGVLLSGVPIRYKAGGCEHIAETLSYKVKNNARTAKAAITLMIRMLDQTPVTEEAKYKNQMFVHFLNEALLGQIELSPVQPTQGKAYTIVCGDGSCEIKVKSDEISFNYDFAL